MFASNSTLLLRVSGVGEAATGIACIAVPAVVSDLLLGSAEPSPEALVFARLAGVALLCIGVASWLSKGAGRGAAQRAQLVGLTIYYALGAIVLAYAGVTLKLTGVLLWPAILIHLLFAAWCVVGLRESSTSPGPVR